MTITTRATQIPNAATLNAPPWARAQAPQGRSQAESRSRTADRAAHTHADDTMQVSAVSVPAPARRLPMSREPHSPTSANPDSLNPPDAGLPSPVPPFMSLHTSVVILAAGLLGIVMGALMFLAEKSVPKAMAAGLGTFGLSVPVLHKLIG